MHTLSKPFCHSGMQRQRPPQLRANMPLHGVQRAAAEKPGMRTFSGMTALDDRPKGSCEWKAR